MEKFFKGNESAAGVCSTKSDAEYTVVIDSDDDVPINVDKNNKRKKGYSKVWKYFTKSSDKKLAKCSICAKEYKTSGNTSNLRDHLNRCHPDLEKNENSSSTISEHNLRSVDTYFKRSIEYDSNSQRKKDCDSALAEMVCSDIRPLNIVKNSGFMNYSKVLDPRYVLPSARHLRDVVLMNKYNVVKKKLRTILDDVANVAITCDGWSSIANESYLTVTCHFIDDKLDLQSAVLSTKKLNDVTNHTGENIANSLRSVLSEWSIFDKVVCVVTDNAPVMSCAARILEKSHLPCFAHTLNLVVQDVLSKNEDLANLRQKCRGIVQFFKNSVIAYEQYKIDQNVGNPKSLRQEVPTRWNSTYLMIERITATNDSISKVLLSTAKAPPPLTADEINALQEIQSILKLINDATEQISGNKYVTISLIIPIAYGLSEQLRLKMPNIATIEGVNLCKSLIESVQKRLFPYESRTITRLGTILDPRFKKEGFQSSNNADQGAIKLEAEISSLLAKKKGHSDTHDLPTTNNISAPSLFDFIDKRISVKTKSSRADAIITIRQYFEKINSPRSSDPLSFWKTTGEDLHPLKECMQKYLCVPASSVESERVFSTTGQIISKRRARLKYKNVDLLTFLNKNKWLF